MDNEKKYRTLILTLLYEYASSCYTFLLSINPWSSIYAAELRRWTLLLRDITIDNWVTNHLMPLESRSPCASREKISFPCWSPGLWEIMKGDEAVERAERFVKVIKRAPGRAISRHHWSMFKVSGSWWWPQRSCTESTAEKVNQTHARFCWLILVTADAWTPSNSCRTIFPGE